MARRWTDMACCACSSPATGAFRDGAHLKPVCDQHQRKFERENAKIRAWILLDNALCAEADGDTPEADTWLEIAAEEEAHAFA